MNPFSTGTAFMLMQTGWIQASRRVTRWLAWDPTCLLLSQSFLMKNKQNLKVLKNRRQHNLFLENYPAFKGLKEDKTRHPFNGRLKQGYCRSKWHTLFPWQHQTDWSGLLAAWLCPQHQLVINCRHGFLETSPYSATLLHLRNKKVTEN